jgi:hypothetical protein
MPLNLASPGLVVREVDLTVGRIDPTADGIGAIVAPFARGPINLPVIVENESDLLANFGEPASTDKHYEHWLVASSYLAYGGSLQVVRADSTDLKNAFVGSASSIKIRNLEEYYNLGYEDSTIAGVTLASRNPGSWANGVKVCLIDGFADQILGVTTANITVGMGITQALSAVVPGSGTTTTLTGHLKGIITGVGTAVAGLSTTQIAVKILAHVSTAGTETPVDYQPSGVYTFASGTAVAISTAGGLVTSRTASSAADWFDAQTIALSNGSSLSWTNLANRPATSEYATERNSRFDEVHVVVIDDKGTITGNAGSILEKHIGLSKAKDSEFSVGSSSYWRKYIATGSNYIYAGGAPSGLTTTGFAANTLTPLANGGWDQASTNVTFACVGNASYSLDGGKDYNGASTISTSGAMTATLANIVTGYELFENTEQYNVDYLLMGSANYAKETCQAIANKLISVAELRKDAIAFISPYRLGFLNDTSVGTVTVNAPETITTNVISFYSPVASSSYAVFDSGYKYMYDKFADTFRYVPINGDIAGLCARNDANNFPWFSPAGTSRGAILNAVKLAYNPSKSQRDKLYSNRVNSVIFSPGAGIVLFGDKTALAKSSAFDRINVRRLFIYLEDAISAAAKDQLFEFNDATTRANFVNIVDPFLRDVQAKRGIQEYRLICDETNNTAAVIDNNEFVADIFIKPARSINFIGLTFIATRSGVSFEEIIGTV